MILFLHANGYPPASYGRLLDLLRENVEVWALEMRPLDPAFPPGNFRSWGQLADEVIAEMETQGLGPYFGVGHSLGAVVLLLAAHRRPDLFRGLVLLDPVLLPLWVYAVGAVMSVNWLEGHAPLAVKALRRRDHWPDRASAWRQLRSRKVFRRILDPEFTAMLDGMMATDPKEGVRLRFPKAWEARVYATPTWPYTALWGLRTPLCMVRGERSDTIAGFTWWWLRILKPRAHQVDLPDAGHLLPFEKPVEVAAIIRSFFASCPA